MNDYQRIEYRDLLSLLRERGHGELLHALEDQEVYTAKGKVCRSRVAKKLDIDVPTLERRLAALREDTARLTETNGRINA